MYIDEVFSSRPQAVKHTAGIPKGKTKRLEASQLI